MNDDKKPTRPFAWAVLTGIVLAAVLTVVITLWPRRSRGREFQPRMALSGEQIRKVASAVKGYVKRRGSRPGRLEDLLAENLLEPRDLIDARRQRIPAADSKTGPPAVPADVLYFPALREKDPNELVMLCTVLLHDADDKYRVVRNDGRYVEMGRRELTRALNRTYWYLGAKLQRKKPWTVLSALRRH